MVSIVFEEVPHPQLLQWLVKSALKQNLLKSLRLWVELQTLYGGEYYRLPLEDDFTYPQWRDAFFHPTHPTGEAIPHPHHPDCNCQKTVKDWIFQGQSQDFQQEWTERIQPYLSSTSLEQLLNKPLFAVTRRTLQGDFYRLIELNWLNRDNSGKYWQKSSHFPDYPRENPVHSSSYLPLVNIDLEAIAENLSQPIGGYQRFFLDVDYIISDKYLDHVEDCQSFLKEIWEKSPITPISFIYRSVKYESRSEYIVYPVCLYYVRRAIYLCAIGQTPAPSGQWYNFRLDKIGRLSALTWQDPQIPTVISSLYPDHLPTPDDIQIEMEKAWGFDFYLEAKLMILRFESKFHDRYIKGTYRHASFQRISYVETQDLIKKNSAINEKNHLLKILATRSPDDAYYKAYYRDGDINVLHRLFSWRPHLEILFPFSLRQAIAQDVTHEYQLYR